MSERREEYPLFAAIAEVESFGYTVTPPYVEPKFQPGDIIVSGEERNDGTRWAYIPTSASDSNPFRDLVTGQWFSRDELPKRLKVLYRHEEGQ